MADTSRLTRRLHDLGYDADRADFDDSCVDALHQIAPSSNDESMKNDLKLARQYCLRVAEITGVRVTERGGAEALSFEEVLMNLSNLRKRGEGMLRLAERARRERRTPLQRLRAAWEAAAFDERAAFLASIRDDE